MKKIFIFAATAALLASCAQDEVLNNYEPTAEKAIGFSTIANKVTRAENSGEENKLDLYLHHESFSVYGYKNVNASPKGINVFNDQSVTVNSDNTTSYDPVRYWDKAASDYFFYAAAPADGAWSFIAPTDAELTAGTIDTGYYTTSSTLTGANITTFTGDDAFTYQEYFKGSGDIDKLIADPCPVQNPAYNKSTADVVELNFNHILSRLNVEVKSAITPKYNQLKVTVGEDTNLPLFSYDTDKLCVKYNDKYYQVTKGDGGTYSYTLSGDAKIEVTETVTEVKDESEAVSGKVELVGIYVYNLVGDGSFSEDLTTAGINETELKNGTIKRWNLSSASTTETISNTNLLDLSVPTPNNIAISDYKYVCQSLVIPQKAEYEVVALDGSSTKTKPYINVQFKIDDQPYSYFYNLAAVFSNQLNASYEKDGFKYAKTSAEGTYAYEKGGSYYVNMTEGIAAYTNVVFRSGNETTGYTYQNASGILVYFNGEDNKYYTADDFLSADGFAADVVILGTYDHPEYLTNAEAATGATPIDAEACALDFCEGWQNNLLVKIGPSAIQFIGHVYKWDDYKTSELTVE